MAAPQSQRSVSDVEPLFIALQAVAGPTLEETRPRAPERACRPARDGEVTVCGRRDEHRLKPLPERYGDSALPKAEATVFGKGKLSIETEQRSIGGVPSNRVMVRIKIPL